VNKKDIIVLPMGINVPQNIKDIKKEKEKTLIFVGRLTAAKGIEETLNMLKQIVKRNMIVKLWIVGRGEASYVQKLQGMCRQLHIQDYVIFFGFVSEKKKFTLLARAHLLIHPSLREGFGLTIPEAGCVGTPVVAYNSPGLRDIVKNGKNGILVPEKSPESLASTVIQLLSDDSLYQKLCQGAKAEARQYNWDKTASVMLDSLRKS
jgi:glycosyltransferase involved in cell wall biosynthesis